MNFYQTDPLEKSSAALFARATGKNDLLILAFAIVGNCTVVVYVATVADSEAQSRNDQTQTNNSLQQPQ
jgi:hypothetical protein